LAEKLRVPNARGCRRERRPTACVNLDEHNAPRSADAQADWHEVTALVTGSYRALAPKKLAGRVDRFEN
jgi:hypothetical protein